MQNQAPDIFASMAQDPHTPLNGRKWAVSQQSKAKRGFYPKFGSLAQNQVGKVGKSFFSF